jgi:hypothetical protein
MVKILAHNRYAMGTAISNDEHQNHHVERFEAAPSSD